MIRRPPRSTLSSSSAASDVYKRQEQPFTPDDLKALEKSMQRIVKERQRFVRRAVTDEQAREELADQPYKLELIGIKGHASDDDGASVEVGAGEPVSYTHLRAHETVLDLVCRLLL